MEINYTASPTAAKFHASDAFVRGIMGPIGSGKSVACCLEIFKKACEQHPGPDGIRRTRWLITRNTLPQLESTTIKTWLAWFPEKQFGRMTRKPPYTQIIEYGDVKMEVIFLALDKPEDVNKLLSFECTGIWYNEARETNKELVDAGTGRVGRYPGMNEGGCTWSGIIMDTNPPDDSHWWYQLSELEAPESWEFFKQPSGLHEDAENLENLNQPPYKDRLPLEERRRIGRLYYTRMCPGKTKEWIRVYVDGRYGFSALGKPVYASSWNDDLHRSEKDLEVDKHREIVCGVDCSGRNPAAIFLQKNNWGGYTVLDELVCRGMGAVSFSEVLKSESQARFPTNDIRFFGDPAGAFGSQNDERTYFEILRGKGINVLPTYTNKIGERVQAVESVLLRMAGAPPRPALLVSPKCKVLISGMNGGYRFKRMNVSGGEVYDEKPEKNRFSDIQDALQYAMLGCGEGHLMKGRNSKGRPQGKANINFNV